MPHAISRSQRRRGFTLVEVLVVLLIFGVLTAMAAVITRAVTAAQKRSLTATRMAIVESALTQFVLQQKRLPCPADGRKPSSDNNAGLELRNVGGQCTVADAAVNTQQYGIVPWRSLALTDLDIMDGWDRRLTYRVDATLVANGGMDMSMCDPASTVDPTIAAAACNTACSSANLGNCTPPAGFLKGKGIQVQDAAGNVLMNPNGVPHTGAAYVVISHGESGGGGYTNNGQLTTSIVTDGTEEQRNYANTAFTVGVAYYFADTALNDVSGANHFDDIVLRPSILSVAAKAGLAARSH